MPFACHTKMQQQFIDNYQPNLTKYIRILIPKKQKLSDATGTYVNEKRSRLAEGWVGGKAVALYGKKTKTESRDCPNVIPDSCLVPPAPNSVCENLISCLFHKLSRQENHVMWPLAAKGILIDSTPGSRSTRKGRKLLNETVNNIIWYSMFILMPYTTLGVYRTDYDVYIR